MKLLSLDTAINNTGYAVYENGELTQYGTISIDDGQYEKMNLTARLKVEKKQHRMVSEIYSFMDDINPDFVIAEFTEINRNQRGTLDLTMILGAVFGYCEMHNIFFSTYSPSSWRKLASNKSLPRKRDELKEWSKNRVKEIFKIELDSDDTSDAILIGYAYYMEFGKEYLKV